MARAELLLQIVTVERSKTWYRELNNHWIFCCHRSGDFLLLESVSVESRRNITAYTSSRQNPAKPRGWVDRVFITICANSLEFLCLLKQALINFSLAAVKHFGGRCLSCSPRSNPRILYGKHHELRKTKFRFPPRQWKHLEPSKRNVFKSLSLVSIWNEWKKMHFGWRVARSWRAKDLRQLRVWFWVEDVNDYELMKTKLEQAVSPECPELLQRS